MIIVGVIKIQAIARSESPLIFLAKGAGVDLAALSMMPLAMNGSSLCLYKKFCGDLR